MVPKVGLEDNELPLVATQSAPYARSVAHSLIAYCGTRVNFCGGFCVYTVTTNTKAPAYAGAFVLVRSVGLEPTQGIPIRPSNVRVCQFRHDRSQSLSEVFLHSECEKYYIII